MARQRQTRLAGADPEVELADTVANYRVLRKAFLSASALSSFSYCNVKPFIERLLQAAGLDVETPEMRAGTLAHEELQNALAEVGEASELTMREAIQKKEFLYGHEYPLKDERRMLRGIADLVFTTNGVPYILELKNTVPPKRADPVWAAPLWYEHGLQLQFYHLMAAQEFRRAPHLALSYLKGQPRGAVLAEIERSRDPERSLMDLYAMSAQVEATEAAREETNRMIRSFRRAEKGPVLPRPNHANPRKCSTCRVRTWCPRRLDQPGVFERLNPSVLDSAP